MAEPSVTPDTGKPQRLWYLDAQRGLIMVLMALDHAALMVAHVHPQAEMYAGPFPVYYDTLAFLTRFVTHFCAPGFFFLMGAGMALFALSRAEKGWSKRRVLSHFWLRAAVLIALKFLVINRIWSWSPAGWGIDIYIGVIFALAGTMAIGSLLLWLRPAYLLAFSVLWALAIEWLVPAPAVWVPTTNWLSLLLWAPGGLGSSGPRSPLWSNYPVLQWLELVTLGMAFGQWLAKDPRQALARAWKMGVGFLAAFAVLRYLNGFGNLRPRMGDTWIDFLNPVKYPPSLTFVLMTMGVNLLLLRFLATAVPRPGRGERPPQAGLSGAGAAVQRVLQTLVTFGRTPFFFYVVHLALYAAMGYIVSPHGMPLTRMYPFWLLGLVILYPLCLWYGRLKDRQEPESLLRFL